MAHATDVSKRHVPTTHTIQKMLCQYLDIERFTPDSHKIVFNKVGDEHPDSVVDKGHDVSHGETRASA